MKSRAKSRPKLVAQQADECEDKNETVFKHYDNKFFDMDCVAEGPKPCAIPVPDLQELQQYVTNCYDALYKDFNAFKSSVTNQLLSLQEEVQTLSFHNSSRNDDVFPEAVKESQSQCGYEAIEGTNCSSAWQSGRTDKFCQWHSKARVPDYEEYEKTPQFHHEMRLHHRPDSTSPAPTDEPSPRQHLIKRPSYQIDDDRIRRIPANAWSNASIKISESSGRGAFNQTDAQSTEKKQEATYLSRHLHGSRSPNSTHGLQKSTSRVSKISPGWSPEKSNELFPTSTTTAWEEQVEGESKEYADAEEENEQAHENMVSEYSNQQSNEMREKDKGSSNGQVKGGAGRDRFMLHGWAATFLQQPTDVQSPKGNEQYMKQEILKFNDKERTSKVVASEDTQRGELRTEKSVAEMEMTSKRPGLAKEGRGTRDWIAGNTGTLRNAGSLSRSNSQDLKLAQNMNYMNLSSSKPIAADNEKRESKDLNQEKTDNIKFPGKKCRGGIAWTVDELAEQNKQRAVI